MWFGKKSYLIFPSRQAKCNQNQILSSISPIFIKNYSLIQSRFEILQLKYNQQIFNQKIMRFLQDQQGEGEGQAQAQFERLVQIHYLMMIVVWLAAGNIGLWNQAFKHYKWANYVHLFCMGIVTIITWMSGFLAIINFGTENEAGDFHTNLGIAILAIITAQAIGGVICFILQKTSKIRPDIVPYINWAHHFLGYVCFILVLIQILEITKQNQPKLFIPVIVISLVSYVAFLLFRLFQPRMQKYSAIPQQDDNALPLVKNARDLQKFNGQYFIFADKIYDINKVITNHPGGYQVINQIRGREVDRFLYGSEPIESLDNTRVHSHSSSSISLAGDPIGIMVNNSPYQNMKQINEVSVQLTRPCKNKFIVAPYLASKSGQFLFESYTDLSQFGKYYAVTLNSRKTRLYSVVNFLQHQNIDLVNKIAGRSLEQKELLANNTQQQLQTNMKVMNQNLSRPLNSASIPLLIKFYQKGEFTSTLLNGKFKGDITISKPRGRGLMLHDIPPGPVILFAGGTGLNPYCDLIDQLFKEYLVSVGSPYSGQIISFNPLVQQKILLNKFKFNLYYAVRQSAETHEAILYQLNQLARAGVINTYMRVDHNADLLSKNYPSIRLVSERFQHFVPQIANQIESISHIFICGPPMMGNAMVKYLTTNSIPRHKYTVL